MLTRFMNVKHAVPVPAFLGFSQSVFLVLIHSQSPGQMAAADAVFQQDPEVYKNTRLGNS